MPKPYFLPRPSGLYVRFRVPTDLRSAVGFRFILRSLRGLGGDAARLSAACLAVALSDGFDALRKGMVDFKKLLDSAQQAADSGSLRDWTAIGVKVGGVDFGTVTTSGPQDTLDFIKTLQAAAGIVVPAQTQTMAVPVQVVAPVSDAPLLSVEIANHIADLERSNWPPTRSPRASTVCGCSLASSVMCRSTRSRPRRSASSGTGCDGGRPRPRWCDAIEG